MNSVAFEELIFFWPSTAFLQRRLNYLFGNHNLKPVLVGNRNDLIWPKTKMADIVFFGDYRDILEDSEFFWPKYSSYRLWTLCREMKDILSSRFPVESIGVIPRYSVFPRATARPFPDFQNEEWSMVISSSLLPDKNIDVAIYFFRYLTEIKKLKVKLFIFAPEIPGIKTDRLVKKIKLLKNAKYDNRVRWDWHKSVGKNPVFFNFSTTPTEDFGVSLAQVQNLGWPVILSHWMAHKDVESESKIFIDQKLILKVKKKPKEHVSKLFDILVHDSQNQPLRPKALKRSQNKNHRPKSMTHKQFINGLLRRKSRPLDDSTQELDT
jgi:hypothetical protein